MNSFLLLTLIILFVITPLSIIIFRQLTKQKLIVKLWSAFIIMTNFIAVAFLFVGIYGYRHLYWVVPLYLILILFVSTFLVKNIQKPLKSFIDASQKISKGDLKVDVGPVLLKRNDEFGLISRALVELSKTYDSLSKGILEDGQKINELSLKVKRGSQNMFDEANQQAASVEEISSSMEQMLSNIDQNSENSQKTEQIANKSASNIAVVNKAVGGAVISVKSIVEKVSVIKEFAGKTNLLAINAAIEAARAGEHGRGFAVVASEVRKLAESSQVAATEINKLTSASVKTFDQSVTLLEAVIPEIKKTSELVREITAASIEQRSGAEQINSAIQELNQHTQQNVSLADALSSDSNSFLDFVDNLMKRSSTHEIS